MTNSINITNNITPPNQLEILKKHFAHCFTKNGSFDFAKFKQELSAREDNINFYRENYGMDWLGKSYARLLASDSATTLLREDEAWNQQPENKDSQNLLINGDNLEVLKHLVNAYYERVKMIYIDPPYNTGGDGFVYQDDRKFTKQQLSELAGIDEEKAQRILNFTQSKSNSHSAWLTFMYPRLYIAKQLLKEDGAIFVSIDDNEVAQLRLLMDEIFGEENFVETFKWNKTSTPPSLSNKVRGKYEFLICYEKNSSNSVFNGGITQGGDMPLLNESNQISNLVIPKEKVRFNFNGKFKAKIYDRVELLEAIEITNGAANKDIKIKGKFKWSQEFLDKEILYSTSFVIKTSKFSIRYIRNGERIKKPADVISKIECNVGTNEDANKEQKQIFEDRILFSNPKPSSLIKYIVSFLVKENDLILDFFAGSGTTADAVMQLNAEDGGKRKYILVQLPEVIDSIKNKTAYDFVKNELKVPDPTIFAITQERLIRAAKKIKQENPAEKTHNLDLGFKVFATTPIWENYEFEADEFNLQQELFDTKKLTEQDLQTILTTWKTYDGVALTDDLQSINLNGYTGYYNENKIYLMHMGFTTEHLKKFLEEIDNNKDFHPKSIIAFAPNFDSKSLREISEGVKNFSNKKQIEIDFVGRY